MMSMPRSLVKSVRVGMFQLNESWRARKVVDGFDDGSLRKLGFTRISYEDSLAQIDSNV